MGLTNIREFMHAHCRFRLRCGREIFGVVWEGGSSSERSLHFSTIGEYERARLDPRQLLNAIPMSPEEIMLAERLNS
ncbi:MAG: hypothetical protein ABIY71_13830 [Flavobacteriales bacterium]